MTVRKARLIRCCSVCHSTGLCMHIYSGSGKWITETTGGTRAQRLALLREFRKGRAEARRIGRIKLPVETPEERERHAARVRALIEEGAAAERQKGGK